MGASSPQDLSTAIYSDDDARFTARDPASGKQFPDLTALEAAQQVLALAGTPTTTFTLTHDDEGHWSVNRTSRVAPAGGDAPPIVDELFRAATQTEVIAHVLLVMAPPGSVIPDRPRGAAPAPIAPAPPSDRPGPKGSAMTQDRPSTIDDARLDDIQKRLAEEIGPDYALTAMQTLKANAQRDEQAQQRQQTQLQGEDTRSAMAKERDRVRPLFAERFGEAYADGYTQSYLRALVASELAELDRPAASRELDGREPFRRYSELDRHHAELSAGAKQADDRQPAVHAPPAQTHTIHPVTQQLLRDQMPQHADALHPYPLQGHAQAGGALQSRDPQAQRQPEHAASHTPMPHRPQGHTHTGALQSRDPQQQSRPGELLPEHANATDRQDAFNRALMASGARSADVADQGHRAQAAAAAEPKYQDRSRDPDVLYPSYTAQKAREVTDARARRTPEHLAEDKARREQSDARQSRPAERSGEERDSQQRGGGRGRG